jgi:hypothetical protein
MSDLTALMAMAFLLVVAMFFYFYVIKMVNRIGYIVLTGVLDGVPISTTARRGMLIEQWVPYQAGPILLGAFLAFAATEVADQVGDTSVRTLMYFSAFIFAVMAVSALANTVSGFLQYRIVLRRARRSS